MYENRKIQKTAQDPLKRFLKKCYKEANLHKQISRVDSFDRRPLLQTSNPIWVGITLFSVTCKYLGTKLPSIKEVINKHLHITNISSTLKSIFDNTKFIIAFRKNTSRKQIIGTNTFEKKMKNSDTNQNNSENETFVGLHSSINILQANNTQ